MKAVLTSRPPRVESAGAALRALAGPCRQLADAALSVLWAPRCAACDRLLDRPTGGAVCGDCWAGIEHITPPACERCGAALASWRALSCRVALCGRCRRRPSVVSRARAAGLYEGTLRDIIHAFKYQGRRSLGAGLASVMRAAGTSVLGDADCVVPVPLHRSRMRRRGFNQSADLAARLGLPVVDALKRVAPTPSQTGLAAAQRRRNVRGAFVPAGAPRAWWKRPPGVDNRIVVLVDDVATTGATLDACARVLLACGAREVRALTAARAEVRRS